ncbi:class I SAM-dependent methyltransferase [Prochlorococcus marinus]|uniref:class I SAM-dependent methyltransferase n=1 Tax=Prochlorococcus marinus TaxID=1219 RepID=UPI0022B2E0D2|nr:class I SAM-dependent methyltransferase [Prochlorococcus marinus]
MNDKNNFLLNIDRKKEINLEIGCGSSKYNEDYIGIDIIDYDNVDIVGDVFEILEEFPSNSVDSIFTRHFLEHIKDVKSLINEFTRVLKVKGKLRVIVPHFANPYYYSDYTHVSSFGLYSFCYLAKDYCNFKRKVPTYNKELKLALTNTKMIFMTLPNTFIYGKLLRLLTMVINSRTCFKELYEERLCYVIPPYELIFDLIKIK